MQIFYDENYVVWNFIFKAEDLVNIQISKIEKNVIKNLLKLLNFVLC